MKVSILKRVNIADFIVYVRKTVCKFPEFMDEEKALLNREIETIEAQSGASRRNEPLNKLKDELIPKLWALVRCLKSQLRSSSKSDEKAANLLTSLKDLFKKRMPLQETIDKANAVCNREIPDDDLVEMLIIKLKSLMEEMNATNKAYVKEYKRIKSIGATMATRLRIIRLLKRAYEVAKGFSYRVSTKKKAKKVVGRLEILDRLLKRHLGRRKRRGAKFCGDDANGGGQGVETQNFASLQDEAQLSVVETGHAPSLQR